MSSASVTDLSPSAAATALTNPTPLGHMLRSSCDAKPKVSEPHGQAFEATGKTLV
jgi:hypothetical protein